ncbi:MAG: hemerythrin domain-containing protein [Pseudomonadota bacterium]
MKHLIESLHEDHRNLSKLLRLLETNLLALQSDNDPDYPLMVDIIEYICSYPNVFHHPREDLLYQKAMERDSSVREEIEPVLQQHAELNKSTHRLLDSLNAVLSDTLVNKAQLKAQIHDFIDFQRAHIMLEESKIFPHIERLLTSDDINWLDEQYPPATDPLFGEQVEERFRQIYEHILDISDIGK